MIGEQSVTVRAVVTTRDANGDSTTSSSTSTKTALFEPLQGIESTDQASPAVVTPARFYFDEALTLNADDEIDAGGVTWRVLAGSLVWVNQTVVSVERSSAV